MTGKAIIIAGMIFVLLGFVGFIIQVYSKTVSGHGLDTYLTGWGVQMNYIGVLILLISVPIVLIIALIIDKIITWHEMKG